MKLGEKIKLVRKHRGLTQQELGERLHLDGNAANRIAQYESGFRTPKESKNKETANALNVSGRSCGMAVLFAVLEPKDTAVYKLITTKPGEAASEG